MTVLLTGGAGYLGSHVNKLLAASGVRTIVFDNLTRGHRELAKWGELVVGDTTDAGAVERAFNGNRVDLVMHLAALAYVGESVTNPAAYYTNNLLGTLNILEAMRKHGVSRIVFSSSCTTFGEARYLPIDEAHPQAPMNPYGRTKLVVESILRDYALAYGIRHCILRYFNIAGADPQGAVGEWHVPETHLIPIALQTAAGVRERLPILGDDYATEDGTCVRDYVHVSDLARAHLQAAEWLEKSGGSDHFNLGIGSGFSVKQVVSAVEKVTERRVTVTIEPRRPGDPPALVSSNAKARTILKWQPQFVELEEIIATAWQWQRRLLRLAARI